MFYPPLYPFDHGTEYPSNTPFSNLNPNCGGDLSLFGQVKNLAIVPALYSWITTSGTITNSAIGASSSNFTTQAKNRIKPLINSATREITYSGRMATTYPMLPFRNVINPVFTPGTPTMQDSDVGGYQIPIGKSHATFTFRLPITFDGTTSPGMFPSSWLEKMSRMNVPGMFGVVFQNAGGDMIMVGVNCTNSSGTALADLLPIPITSIVCTTPALGALDEPGYVEVTITLPPNFDNPYPYGKCLGLTAGQAYPTVWSRSSKLYLITSNFIKSI